jgi:hypothetical protein
MSTTVEQRRRISRYAILVLFMFLVAGSLSTENHWPVFAAITGPADPAAPGGNVASAAFQLRDVRPGGDRDSSARLRAIARDALAASGLGGGNRPADQDRPPEVEPLAFAAAAANPPVTPPPVSTPPETSSPGRPDVGSAGGGCGGGRGGGFVPPGCIVREVAWTLKDLNKEERIATARSLRTVAGNAVAANGDARPAHLDRVAPTSRPERPSRPEVASRPERPTRPEKPDSPGRGPR